MLTKLTYKFAFVVVLAAACAGGSKQQHADSHDEALVAQAGGLRADTAFKVMFYNVENLFDTIDDPHKDDNEFLPSAKRGWNSQRMSAKLKNIYRVAAAAGQGELPAIIGLCELENEACLLALLKQTPLGKRGYLYAHFDSPDPRGIDVAMIYDPARFQPSEQRPIRIKNEKDRDAGTRDILYVRGEIAGKQELHLFVNHWPSRRGGKLETEKKRLRTARRLRRSVDSILQADPQAWVLAMGDFNDYPDDRSIVETLGAAAKGTQGAVLYNLAWEGTFPGSNKHEGHWNYLDQIMVSPALSKRYPKRSFDALHEDFLLSPDRQSSSGSPRRTYQGTKYKGGFSDHLPVVVRFGK